MRRALPILIIAAILVSAPRARADFVVDLSPSVVREQGGGYLYTYTLANGPASTLDGYSFSIDVPTAVEIHAISAPDGWTASYLSGASPAVSWETDDPLALLYPGDRLAFSFESLAGPGPTRYIASGTDGDFASFGAQFGGVIGPAAGQVPEPNSLVLGLLGAVACGARARMRRRPPAGKAVGRPPRGDPAAAPRR